MIHQEHDYPPARAVYVHHLASEPSLVLSPGHNNLTNLQLTQTRGSSTLQLFSHCCQILFNNLKQTIDEDISVNGCQYLAGLEVHLTKHLDQAMLLLNMSHQKLEWFGVQYRLHDKILQMSHF